MRSFNKKAIFNEVVFNQKHFLYENCHVSSKLNEKLMLQVPSDATISLIFRKYFIACYQHIVLTYHKGNFWRVTY